MPSPKLILAAMTAVQVLSLVGVVGWSLTSSHSRPRRVETVARASSPTPHRERPLPAAPAAPPKVQGPLLPAPPLVSSDEDAGLGDAGPVLATPEGLPPPPLPAGLEVSPEPEPGSNQSHASAGRVHFSKPVRVARRKGRSYRPPEPSEPPPLILPIPKQALLLEPDEAIRMMLRQQRGALERCYELELNRQAAFNGELLLAISVSAEGRVDEARVEQGGRRDTAVGICMADRIRKSKLPPLTEDADLVLPVRLEVKEGP